MDKEKFEKMLGRTLSDAELVRLNNVQNVLGISYNDALWEILIMLEYHRAFCEDMPARLTGASDQMLSDVKVAAKLETEKAQNALTQAVVEQAKILALRLDVASLLPWATLLAFCLCLYGVGAMWVGWHLGSGKETHPAAAFLNMPVGWLLGALSLPLGIFWTKIGISQFTEAEKAWWKRLLPAMCCFALSCCIIALTLSER